jgi:hypothetical protein
MTKSSVVVMGVLALCRVAAADLFSTSASLGFSFSAGLPQVCFDSAFNPISLPITATGTTSATVSAPPGGCEGTGFIFLSAGSHVTAAANDGSASVTIQAGVDAGAVGDALFDFQVPNFATGGLNAVFDVNISTDCGSPTFLTGCSGELFSTADVNFGIGGQSNSASFTHIFASNPALPPASLVQEYVVHVDGLPLGQLVDIQGEAHADLEEVETNGYLSTSVTLVAIEAAPEGHSIVLLLTFVICLFPVYRVSHRMRRSPS